jgi:hypothetical protein
MLMPVSVIVILGNFYVRIHVITRPIHAAVTIS